VLKYNWKEEKQKELVSHKDLERQRFEIIVLEIGGMHDWIVCIGVHFSFSLA